MVRVKGDITIRRPLEEVFDFVAEESNEPNYNPRMTRAEKITAGPIGAGTQFNSVMSGVGGAAEMTIELVEFDRPRRITERVHLSSMDIQGLLLFEPVPGGTRMRWVWDLEPRGLMRFLGPIVGLLGDGQERQTWNGLKQLMEGGPGSARPGSDAAASSGR